MKTLKMNQFLGKTLIVVTLILLSMSCTEDDVNPCKELEKACENLLAKIEQVQHPDEKERYRQTYLLAKQELDNCRK